MPLGRGPTVGEARRGTNVHAGVSLVQRVQRVVGAVTTARGLTQFRTYRTACRLLLGAHSYAAYVCQGVGACHAAHGDRRPQSIFGRQSLLRRSRFSQARVRPCMNQSACTVTTAGRCATSHLCSEVFCLSKAVKSHSTSGLLPVLASRRPWAETCNSTSSASTGALGTALRAALPLQMLQVTRAHNDRSDHGISMHCCFKWDAVVHGMPATTNSFP